MNSCGSPAAHSGKKCCRSKGDDMASTKLGEEVRSGYIKATRTLTCPYCWEVRSVDNIHQTSPRVKCKPCFERRGKRR